MNFLINILIKAGTSFLVKLMTAFATEQMFSYTIFRLFKAVAKSTKTEEDDAWVAKMEEAYKNLK